MDTLKNIATDYTNFYANRDEVSVITADGHHSLHRPEPSRHHPAQRPALPGRGNHHAAHADAGE